MNLEQLQALSDAELNELSAVKVMGWEKKRNTPFGTYYFDQYGKEVSHIQYWNPTTDMNDAMELVGSLNRAGWMLYKFANTLSGKGKVDGYLTVFLHIEKGNCPECTDDSPTRSITIASILAKEEDR